MSSAASITGEAMDAIRPAIDDQQVAAYHPMPSYGGKIASECYKGLHQRRCAERV